MTTDDVKKLCEILQHKKEVKDGRKQVNGIFHNKSCRTVIRDTKSYMLEIPKRDRNKVLLIVVLCLLYRNAGHMENLRKVLTEEDLISVLYGGLCIYLGGKSQSMHLKIQWSDVQFPNRYEYLRRFEGQFGYYENFEVLYAAKILAAGDREKFEELVFKDSTRLLLLNMGSFCLEEKPSEALVKRLLTEGDELQANIGFRFAVRKITQDIRDYRELRNMQRIPGRKTRRQIDRNMAEHLETFFTFYSLCTVERKVSLLFNYILSEGEYPIQFGHWLMEAELQEALVNEILFSGKVKHLEDLRRTANLIHDFPCKDRAGVREKKDRLYNAVTGVVKRFVTEEIGIYSWKEKEEIQFGEICGKVPRRHLKCLCPFLRKITDDLMASELDKMVRHTIYLKDKRKWDICQGMQKILEVYIS